MSGCHGAVIIVTALSRERPKCDKFFLLTLKHTLTIEHVGRNKYVKNSRSPLETIAPNTCSQNGL